MVSAIHQVTAQDLPLTLLSTDTGIISSSTIRPSLYTTPLSLRAPSWRSAQVVDSLVRPPPSLNPSVYPPTPPVQRTRGRRSGGPSRVSIICGRVDESKAFLGLVLSVFTPSRATSPRRT